jgi:DNA-directed RNA polymerase subunit L
MIKAKAVENKKARLVVELKGADHIICNSIREELWNDSNVRVAGYNIAHPLVGIPTMIVETNSSEKPQKALLEAVKRQKKMHEKLKKGITESIR